MSQRFEEILRGLMSQPDRAGACGIDDSDREAMIDGLTKLIADDEQLQAHLRRLHEELGSQAECPDVFPNAELPERVIAEGLGVVENELLGKIATNCRGLYLLRGQLLDATHIDVSWIAAIGSADEGTRGAAIMRRIRKDS